MEEQHKLYREIFIHKIKWRSKILLIADSETYKLCIEKNQDLIDSLKLKIEHKEATNFIKDQDIPVDYYNIIIFDNTLEKEYQNITLFIETAKKAMKDTGLIMYITRLSLTELGCINYLYSFIGNNLYIGEIFDTLRQHDLRVIDNYRLCSYYYYLFMQHDVFLLTCELR
jgi:hypothetical protein